MKVQFNSVNYTKQNNLTKTKNKSFRGQLQNMAVYAGSFDPLTNGHFDLIKDASKLFRRLYVLVAKNPKKAGFIPVEERVDLIKESVKELKNVEVDHYQGLTVDYAKSKGAKYLIRGLRTASDLEDEKQISKINEILAPDIKTIFLFSSSENSAVSSSVVRELLANKGNIQRFVPDPVYEYLMSHFIK